MAAMRACERTGARWAPLPGTKARLTPNALS